jgi:type IX secretion system PorP/SprF family membrane protein
MKKICFAILSIFEIMVYSQDTQISQFYSSIYFSPSFAGAIDGNRLVLNLRNQWINIDNGYKTQILSFDSNIEKYNCGAGIYIMNDKAGELNYGKFDIGLLYSYDIKIKNVYHIRPGLTFNYYYYSFDRSKLILPDQIHIDYTTYEGYRIVPSVSDPSTYTNNLGNFDGAVSCLFYTKAIWTGFTVDHLFRPNFTYLSKEEHKIPLKYSFFGGYKYMISSRLGLKSSKENSLSLAFLYKKQYLYDQLDIGAYYYYIPVYVGLWYRGIPFKKTEAQAINHDAIIIMAGYKYRSLRLAYSFDLTISKLNMRQSWGGHEISVVFEFPKKIRKKKYEPLPCPIF